MAAQLVLTGRIGGGHRHDSPFFENEVFFVHE